MQLIKDLENVLDDYNEISFINISSLSETQKDIYYRLSQLVRDNLNLGDRQIWVDSIYPLKILVQDKRVIFSGGVILGILQEDYEVPNNSQWDECFNIVYDRVSNTVINSEMMPSKYIADYFLKIVDSEM